MVEVPGWNEEIHDAIKALAQLVDDRLPLLTTDENHSQVRQLAAAYLARVRRLIVALDVLFGAGMPDAMGGVLRICLEAWVTGMWVLCVGQKAVDMLGADYGVTSNRYIVRTGIEVELLDVVEDAPQLPNVAERTEAVETHLVEEGDAKVGELMWSFRLVYGGESAAGIHAGLASVCGHIDEQDASTGVRSARLEASDGSGMLLWAATLLAMFARRVFLAFAVEVDDLDNAAEPIQRLGVELNESIRSQDGVTARPPTAPS